MLELSITDLKIAIIKMFKDLIEKTSYFKVTMTDTLKELGQKVDNSKNEQMRCIIRRIDIIKE